MGAIENQRQRKERLRTFEMSNIGDVDAFNLDRIECCVLFSLENGVRTPLASVASSLVAAQNNIARSS